MSQDFGFPVRIVSGDVLGYCQYRFSGDVLSAVVSSVTEDYIRDTFSPIFFRDTLSF